MTDSRTEIRPALRWGVLGAGGIAGRFVEELAASGAAPIVAVASRDRERAASLAGGADRARPYAEYADLLADADVDAVYIATIHPQHEALVVAAAEAGKHVLCEKPLTVDARGAEAAAAAARANGVALVEAMMYRFQPQTDEIRRLVLGGAIGVPLHVDVACVADVPFDPRSRLFDPALGGGAILDVGCYALSYARMIAGWLEDDAAVEPVSLTASGHLAQTGVDDWAQAELVFPAGLTASVTTGIRPRDPSVARLSGSEGSLMVPNPWTPGRDGIPQVVLQRVGEADRVIECGALPLFGAEVAALTAAVEVGESDAIPLRDSIATMRVLDRWRAATSAAGTR
jgi:predicted dehydrogenase